MFHGRHGHEFMAHSHDVVTMILVTDGAVQIAIENSSHQVRAGQLVVIGAHQVHAARPASPAGWEMRSLHLPPHLLPARLGASTNLEETVTFSNPVVSSHNPAALSFLDLHRGSEGDRPEVQVTDQFRSFIAWLRCNMEAFGPQVHPHRPADTQLEHARALIADAVFENTLIDSIAEEVGLSAYALIRRFKKVYGISPHAWRMQARANEAARMLREKTSLADVAGSCGFADQSHMSRIFKKVYGVTPGQYGLMH
jgi:AraC-like DNA-binding protein